MRKIWALCAILVLGACATEQQEFVTLKGTLLHPTTGDLVIKGRTYTKILKVDAAGKFEDTLKVTTGMHNLQYNKQQLPLFLKNGDHLSITFQEADITKGVEFSGIGKETNEYIAIKRAFSKSESSRPKSYFQMEEAVFLKAIAATELQLKTWVNNASKVDPVFLELDEENNIQLIRYVKRSYKRERAKMLRLAIGTASPAFLNYENNAGGTHSLSDFKGKFVYIDLWATWCGPCKREIPFMKALEGKFHGENIVFLSISLDKKSAYGAWKKMIKEKEMGGVQLIADKDFSSDFAKAYGVTSIPRFILLDPKGIIIDANAVRPSSPELQALLTKLLQ